MPTDQGLEVATLGGGCFWCLEAVYDDIEGVERVESGYAGGHVPQPSYRQVCGGDTGHAEVVQVTYDPARVSYRDLLEVFFAIHDPTTRDRQGNDVGTQYRSVIYVHSAQQREQAQAMIAELTAEKVFGRPIVTQVEQAPTFFVAEDYHQDYYRNHGYESYCQFVVAPKLAKFRQKFASRRKLEK
jgi:peptide-methionine (S)-S-oxide reductase